VKYPKIANSSTTTNAREKIRTDMEALKFLKFFDVGLSKFKNNQISPNKISHRFLMTTML
jgi:hypothetical protein